MQFFYHVEGLVIDHTKLWVAVSSCPIDQWDGQYLVDLPREDIVVMAPVGGCQVSNNIITAPPTVIKISEEDGHNTFVLYQWNGCALRSPLIAWYNYDTRYGELTIDWPGSGGVLDLSKL
jgi:hypothetical protein